MAYTSFHPGSKSCGEKSIDKTIDCLCDLDKDSAVRAGTLERFCKIDHNVGYACLETLAPHENEYDIWGGICEDKRRLIRKGTYIWWLDSPETSFDWWPLGLFAFALALNIGVLAWQASRRKASRETTILKLIPIGR
jgi:hypothetical protein